jgi:hypothetical protein
LGKAVGRQPGAKFSSGGYPWTLVPADIQALGKVGQNDREAIEALIGYASGTDPLCTRDPRDSWGARAAAVEVLGHATTVRGDLRQQIIRCLVSVLREVQKGDLYEAPSGCFLNAIRAAANFGADAREAVPLLKSLKFNSSNRIRDAASAALQQIEKN